MPVHRYITYASSKSELEEGLSVVQNDPLSFWSQHSFRLIADLARYLMAAPASQAFVERIFWVCGMLTQCRRMPLAGDESLPQTEQSSAGSG